jgi:hypothetical protein
VLQQFRYQGRNPLDNRILRWHLLALDPQTWMNEPNWDHNTAVPSRSQAKQASSHDMSWALVGW